MIDSLLIKLAQLAEIEFADVVIGYDIIEGMLSHFHDGMDSVVFLRAFAV